MDTTTPTAARTAETEETRLRVLLAEDDSTQRRLITAMLERAGIAVSAVADGLVAWRDLQEALARREDLPHCLILDLEMPQMGGIELLRRLRAERIDIPAVILTAHAGIDRIVEAMRAGAFDFLVKPPSAERLRQAVAAAARREGLTGELPGAREPAAPPPDGAGDRREAPRGFDRIIGSSPPIEAMRRLAVKAAASSIPVLLEGESGVGKELFARAIHEASARANGPFVVVNCGAIPENLVEATLFGHEKGAFTDAHTARAGKFQEASGGTLFLDEVGELSPAVQVKLLRALQEGEVDPVGARRPVRVDIRLISATNRSLDALVAEGRFREDLYYRLAVFPLRLPPLRARREDIAPIAEAILESLSRREGLPRKRLSADALAMLRRHDWPGNVRQLHNLLFRAVVLSDGETLAPHDFPEPAEAGGGMPGHPPSPAADAADARPSSTADHAIPLIGDDGRPRTLREMEREIIARTLTLAEGCMSRTARLLGIGRSTLYRKILQYGIDTAAARDGTQTEARRNEERDTTGA